MTSVLQSTAIISSTTTALVTLRQKFLRLPLQQLHRLQHQVRSTWVALMPFIQNQGHSWGKILFYTDQLGNIQQINGTGYNEKGHDSSWSRASPAVIVQDVLPGSLVQAVLLASGEVCLTQL